MLSPSVQMICTPFLDNQGRGTYHKDKRMSILFFINDVRTMFHQNRLFLCNTDHFVILILHCLF